MVTFSLTSCPAQPVDPVELGLRQLYAYAMRHYSKMPKSPKSSTRKELMMRPTTHADPTALREFAELAERLGFESPEITDLKQHPTTRVPRSQTEPPEPFLVTDGAGVEKKWRSGLPSTEQYLEDSKHLFINYLHHKNEEQGEGITSFFVRKSIYSAFFGRPPPLSSEEIQPGNEAVQVARDLERQALERQERERQALERQALERLEQERQELVRQELARQEQKRQELGRQELARRELERQEQERQKLERQKLERQRLERQELERQKLERREQEEKEKQQTRRVQAKKLRRRKPKKILSGRPEKQAQEQRQIGGTQHPNLEDERRLEDQQRMGLDDLFDIEQQPEETL